MQKHLIKDLSPEELSAALRQSGLEPYRSTQILRWLYRAAVRSFDEMTDIPASLRASLSSKFLISDPEIADIRKSKLDGTTKYLLKLKDGNAIETVLLPEGERSTICISSQVGCKFSCGFCASAPFGFVRNLTQGEILDEVITVKNQNPGIGITNLVFMGIGEPFDNYDNVMRSIRIFNSKDAFNIGARKITISTCGVLPGIEKLSKEGLQIELSVSLHASNDSLRSKLLPVNKRYPLKDLMRACKEYVRATKRIITFEYVLLKGINCSEEAAAELSRLIKGIQCKVNAISYNSIPGATYQAPAPSEAKAFMGILKKNGVNATHRKPKGEDVQGGCGQLRISSPHLLKKGGRIEEGAN